MTPQEREEGYKAWIRLHPCAIRYQHTCLGRSECAHVKTRGAGGVIWNNLVPLCRSAHTEQHTIGIKSFQVKYRYMMEAHAIRLYSHYLEETLFVEE